MLAERCGNQSSWLQHLQHHLHETFSENTPPNKGPTADAIAHVAPTMPRYFPLSLMLKRSLMQIFTKMINPPPPIPCMTRPVISIFMLTLTAEIRLPLQKIAFASNSAGLRPKMSLTLPQTGTAPAQATIYADPIHV